MLLSLTFSIILAFCIKLVFRRRKYEDVPILFDPLLETEENCLASDPYT
jgi:hypothetical protein